MQEIKLNRSDQRPLVFYGEEMAFATNKTSDSTRWITVRLFKLKTGGYVAGMAKVTCWDGERDSYQAPKFRSMHKALAHINKVAPNLIDEIKQQITGKNDTQTGKNDTHKTPDNGKN